MGEQRAARPRARCNPKSGGSAERGNRFLFGKPQATGHRARGPRHPIFEKPLPQGRTAAQRTEMPPPASGQTAQTPASPGGAVLGNHAQPRPGSPAQRPPPSGAGVIDRRRRSCERGRCGAGDFEARRSSGLSGAAPDRDVGRKKLIEKCLDGGERATGPLSPYPVDWTAIIRGSPPETRRRILAPIRRRSTGIIGWIHQRAPGARFWPGRLYRPGLVA